MLEVRNVSVTYGRHRALDGTSVTVGKGEICVILGANGAGKSTLLKTIAGMVHAAPGSEIVMNGRTIAGMKPHRIVEEGIALVPEGRGIFGDLTVAENLQLGAFAYRARSHEAETLRRIYELFPRLAERRKQIARTMSGGEQQMVAIGRALMSKPEILMLDEPSLGLSPLLSQELFRSLKAVAETGVGILLVEQNAKQSLKIARRGYLLENGRVTGENSAQALMNDPAVVSAYLGGSARTAQARPRIELPAPVRLPASVEAMGRALGDFAARAGRISQAFVRSMRRDGPMPSAFVGRYDPKAGGDPWREAEEAGRASARSALSRIPARAPEASSEARRVGRDAAALARRASERLAEHAHTARLSSPRPSAFAPGYASDVPPVPAWTGGSTGVVAHGGAPASDGRGGSAAHGSAPVNGVPAREPSLSIADLASRASAIHAAHIAKLRAKRAGKPAPRIEVVEEPVSIAGGSHGLIGHNSAGLDVEEAGVRDAEPEAPASTGPTIADLAARAAEIQARHIAARRVGMAERTGAQLSTAKSPTSAIRITPPPLTPPLKGEGANSASESPSPLRGGVRGGGSTVEDGPSSAYHPAEVRDPVREAVPGSIGDLVARAASIHASHVAAGRKRLATFTIPAQPSGRAKKQDKEPAATRRKKHKET